MSGPRFTEAIRKVARDEARRVSPALERWRVVKKSPLTLESLTSDVRLIEGEEDFDISRKLHSQAKVGAIVMVSTDEHGDRTAISVLAGEGQAEDPDITVIGTGLTLDEDGELTADGIDISHSKGFVAHGEDPAVARPVGFPSVEWNGIYEPVNAIDTDTWVNPGRP